MNHTNYYIFSATSNYDLGLQMGRAFQAEAKMAIEKNRDEGFEGRKKTAEKMLHLTQEHFPQYIEEIKGHADGAGVDFLEMWTVAIEDDAYAEENGTAKCTGIITNNGKLLAHSEDQYKPGLGNTVCIIKRQIRDLTMLEIYYYNTLGGVSVGVNSYGYANAGNTLLNGQKKIGIPKGIIGRYFLETSDPQHDFSKIQQLNLADGYNHNLINTEGKVINIELSSSESVISNPPLPFVHSNHCLNLKDREQKNDDYGTITRLNTARKETKLQMSFDKIKKILEDNTNGPDKSIYNVRTVGRMIIDLERLTSYIWLLREEEKGWIEYPLDFIN